ncbi:MAG: hypothetical protein V2J51_05905 [Erythrobacter sp.]|nr:hypothetical protein [Erythrobacter sp.]
MIEASSQLKIAPARSQSSLARKPYDRWLAPDGVSQAEFYRSTDGFIIRFVGQAEFHLGERSDGGFVVTGWPAKGSGERVLRTLYRNAIQPLIGNHSGGLFLHGSAVQLVRAGSILGGAIAFLGLSRSGKTTLAGALAKAGHPLITEDAIDIDIRADGHWVRPRGAHLRLFHDSARHLLGAEASGDTADEKCEIAIDDRFPVADEPAPLKHLFILGKDHHADLAIRKLSSAEALPAILPHSFVLDVEDRERLAAHFVRIADLAQAVCCHALDYPRQYAELPRVLAAIAASTRTASV